MMRRCSFPLVGPAVLLFLFLPFAAPVAGNGQVLRPFTIDDALRVRTASIGDVTKDARWIAATIRTSRSGMNRDHLRHGDPTYMVDGVIHYCVANMPGAVPKTSTIALTNATLPYAVEIANKGWERAVRENPEIKLGANVVKGKVTYKGVADAFGLEYVPIDDLI